MKSQIVRFNEAALYALGMDRPTVQALRNALRITGSETDGITVPELAGESDETKALVEVVRQQVILLQVVADYIQAAPTAIPPTLAEQVDQLQSEVRQISDQVATLTKQFELDMRPTADQFSQFSNQIITEVRQLADQQTVNNNMIQEIRQGTML